MSRVSSFRSKNREAKRRKILFYKIAGVVVVMIGILLVTSFLSKAPFFQVQAVEVSGNHLVPSEAIQQIVDIHRNSVYAWLFSKNNAALLPKKQIEDQIYSQFKTIDQVAISFEGLKKLSVNVHEHEPAYLWCASEAREKCYFMDASGYVFTESADFSQNVLFTFYGLLDPANPVTQTFLPMQEFAELNKFVQDAKLLGLSPIGLKAKGEDDFELLLGSDSKILFSNREDYLTTFENLETIFAEQTRLDRDFLSKLDYIDVRFTSKAFVKTRGIRN